MIERLDHLRLLTFDRDPATGAPTVEIAHEALLNHWPRLREWTDGQRDQLRARRALRGDAEAKPPGEKILERLTLPEAPASAPAPAPQPFETVDQKKLDSLAKSAQPGAPGPAAAAEPRKAADLEKANEKLASLVGKPK